MLFPRKIGRAVNQVNEGLKNLNLKTDLNNLCSLTAVICILFKSSALAARVPDDFVGWVGVCRPKKYGSLTTPDGRAF